MPPRAVIPSRQRTLEIAAGFIENHLGELRQRAIGNDAAGGRSEEERNVLAAMEFGHAAGQLRAMAAAELSAPRVR